MKKIILIGLLTWSCAFAQVKNGEQVPDIEFKTILNSSVKDVKLSQLKGKVVLIDFWATWCSPCVAAMPHLQALQKKFKNQLQVVTVSDETVKRVELFLKVRPSNLWFAIDKGETLNVLFPHRTIPHVVLIDAEGKLIANTSSEEVTEAVMAKLIKKETVDLKIKSDNMTQDFIKDYFFAADTVQSRLLIQPEIKGGPSMSRQFRDVPVFAGRRLTMINLGLQNMYRIAYGGFAYGRVIDQTTTVEKNREERFCLDLITKTAEELLPTLKSELLKRFELQAKIEQFPKSVYVLKVEDQAKVNQITVSKVEGKGAYGGGSGTFSGDGVVFEDIADYLESFGIVNLPVIDETKINTKFNIQLVYQPENPASLTKALAELGLKLEKAERKIDMLVLYK
ncbi:TIGR03435 family protein [Pedobacter sp. Hv1]|uniref:TIGR03435 family protein n=1 Tax=Pedobacter sp. Hv1 TaxID=1740090 RepID=UPI0006D8CE37|nr:TIGR03435 family protein [Pedobacter sp. Hv1]KQC00963.1 hypothetical protein AQF98_09840 [Pedobacter sp. Hv1]